MTGLIALFVFFAVSVGQPSALAQEATNTVVQPTKTEELPLPAAVQNETNVLSSVDDESATQEVAELPPQPQQPSVTNAPLPLSQIPPAPTPAPARADEAAGTATIEFEFQGASVNALLEWYAKLTNRSIVSAPNLAGTINFHSQTKLTKDEAIQALDSVLAINNIAAIPLGDKFLKIVQIATAKQEGIPVGHNVSVADTLGTQILPLKYADAAEVVTVLQPYLHTYGQLMALLKSNSILITETASNLKQMMEIVTYVDQPSALRMEMRSYVMKYAKAGDIVQRLQAIIQETEQAGARATAPGQPGQPVRRILPQPGQPGAAGTVGSGGEASAVEGKVIMTADERTNKIFILTRPSNFEFFTALITELDAKVEPDVVTKVIELQYANAEDVASLLNSLITGAAATSSHRTTTTSTSKSTTTTGARAPAVPPPTSAVGGAGIEGTGFLQFAEGLRILPDPRTNSLLVMATKEDMARIEALVRSVDGPVAQVMIEVVIAEISLNNELDVGVDVFKRLFSYGQVSQVGGYSTSGNTPQNLISTVVSNVPTYAALAGSGGLTYFATFQNLKLDAVVHALATTSKSKILSTPVIQTMDNQEASILVGESVPVPVSTVSTLVDNTGTLSTGSLNANIEYKDVAIELKVTPRINPDGYVRMDIEQKVNDIGAYVTISGMRVPTILKREAKSSVAVQDGSTIVLGGLIKENKGLTEAKVPILGDIPILGQLFKSQANTKTRTELLIFIRPIVLRNDTAAMAEARRRGQMLKGSEDLELSRHFPDNDKKSSQKTPKPESKKIENETTPQSAATDPSEPQSTNVKALKMKDADTTAQ